MKSRFVVLFIAGSLFGFGLGFSGMANPARVIGFLDVTGRWDPSLLFVMLGAVSTYGLGMIFIRRKRSDKGWFGEKLPCASGHKIDARLVIGAALFGIGWGLSGFCPGPAIASIGAFRFEAVLFVGAMSVGMLLAQRLAGVDAN
ncbi:MAG: hypothetical protein QM790_03740 [Nibricoccus sp.]